MEKRKEPKKQNRPVKKADLKEPISNQKSFIFLTAILLISFVAYLPVLQNGFVNWDETTYIQNNLMLRTFNLKEIFSTYILGNYHPLTMFVYTIEYHLFGLNETGYHAVNLLIHLLNVILVYRAASLLSGKYEIALVASLLFGIHPIHVESVAWAAELKDLLYTFFFLASYIYYLKFTGSSAKKYYFIALLLFLLSLLSKAMAASLPVLLIITDYFNGRKINTKSLLEKLPFFALAIAMGVVAIFAQQSTNSIQETIYSFPQRIVIACYGFVTYLIKIILPLNLSAFYPYPVKGIGIPFQFYIYVILLAGLIAYVIYSMRNTKLILFGLGFFAITVFLVLQLLPVGDAMMADRYAYIPSIGIFYLAGVGFYWLRNKNYKIPAVVLLIIFSVFYSVQTYARCGVWKDAMTLWNDVISKYQTVAFAYNNRGATLMNANKYNEALSDYDKAIELSPNNADALNNRGILYMNLKRNEEALNDFNKTLSIKPDFTESYSNRGLVLMDLNRYDEALNDFNSAIRINPNNTQAYYNRGLLYMNQKKYDESYNDYSEAIKRIPDYLFAIINRGIVLYFQRRFDEALLDYNRAIELQPENPQIYYNKGLVLAEQEKYQEAMSAYSVAIKLRADYVEAYFSKGQAEYLLGKNDLACQDYLEAAKLGYQPGRNAYDSRCK